MKLGWVNLGDGAGISASIDGNELALSGSLTGGGLEGSLGQRIQIGTLRPGMLLPLVAGAGDWERPELDGLYRVVEAAYDFEPSIPWAIKLSRVAVGSISGETAMIGNMMPVFAPGRFALTGPRVGVPGNIELAGPGVTMPPDETTVLDEGRVYTLAMGASQQRWMSWTCTPSEFLAGSPRIQIKTDGTWWTVHGQPPPGVPVRIHNGRYGFQLPVGGLDPKLLVVAPNGTITEHSMIINDFESGVGFWTHGTAAGVEVVRADSEMVWLRYNADRTRGATRHRQGVTSNITLRRGMPGFHVSHSVRAAIELMSAQTGLVTDSDNVLVVGVKTAVGNLMAQRVCLVSAAPQSRIRDLEVWRFEAGLEYRTRSWADPKVTVKA